MEGQAILALLAVLALGMMVGGVLVGAAARAFSGAPSATPHMPFQLPAIDAATIAKVTDDIQKLAAILQKAKGTS